jgi:hypothetical protein
MPKITARDAQVLVAGAFAGQGLHALLRLPHTAANAGDSLLPVVSEIIGVFGLPVGIAILVRNIFAVRVALVYLWLDVLVTASALVIILSRSGLPFVWNILARDTVIVLVGQVVLLGLLVWSRRPQRLADETNNKVALERTGPGADD